MPEEISIIRTVYEVWLVDPDNPSKVIHPCLPGSYSRFNENKPRYGGEEAINHAQELQHEFPEKQFCVLATNHQRFLLCRSNPNIPPRSDL
jgi:hypothetical protein